MKITEVLTAEHSVLLGLLDHLEQFLEELGIRELQALAALLQDALQTHAEAETQLAYAALDQALAEKGQLARLYQDHDEIEGRLEDVQSLADLAAARRRFQALLTAVREHFEFEERHIFPLIERTLEPETLSRLGEMRRRQRRELQPVD